MPYRYMCADLGGFKMNLRPGTGRKERGCSVLYMGNGIARSDCLFCKQDSRRIRIPHSPVARSSQPPRGKRWVMLIVNN